MAGVDGTSRFQWSQRSTTFWSAVTCHRFCFRGGLAPRTYRIAIHARLQQVAAEAKALTGQRTPKSSSCIALTFLLSENDPL